MPRLTKGARVRILVKPFQGEPGVITKLAGTRSPYDSNVLYAVRPDGRPKTAEMWYGFDQLIQLEEKGDSRGAN